MRLSPRKEPFKISLGKRGEIIAANFLVQKGYKILEQNYRCEIGEIDVVAEKNDRIFFIEVKTRSSDHFGLPQESVHAIKQKKIFRAAEWYLKEKRAENKAMGFEVVAVQWHDNKEPEIRHISNAFNQDPEL